MASTRSTMMVGRSVESTRLREIAEIAAAGDPQFVLLRGEAGIGKSRLIEDLRAKLPDDAVVVLGYCVEFGSVGLPYVPLAAIFRGLIGEFGADTVFAAAGPGEQALRALLEGLPMIERDERLGIERLNEVITNLLERLSADRPLVVIIEDLHWADAATLDVLRFAARVLTAGRLMLLLSYRSDDVRRGHPIRGFLGELERNRRTTRVALERLGPRDIERQARALLGRVPTADQLSELVRRSEGVPFFVEELVGVARSIEGDAPVTETLRELLLARYEALGPAAQQLVRVLAAGGGRVEHDGLNEVAGLPSGELDDALRAAVDGGVIVVRNGGYDFRHALVREAVLAELLPGESTRVHTSFARALESLRDEPTRRVARAVLVSYHWMEANVFDRAFAASLDAAHLSRAAFAYTTAAQLGERALGLWDAVADPAEVSGMTHVELLEFTAVTWRNAGESQRALATIELALAGADPAEPETVARLMRKMGMILDALGRAESVGVFERALALLPSDADPMLRANILCELATQYMISGRSREAIDTSTEALETAPKSAGRALSVAANVRGTVLIHDRRIEEGLADYAFAREIAGEDRDALLRYYVNSSDSSQLLGRFAEALATATAGLDLARAAGVERTSGALLTVNTVDPLFATGDWDRADELIETTLELDPPVAFRVYLRHAKLRSTLWRGDAAGALAIYEKWATSMTEFAAFEEQTRAALAIDMTDVQLALGDLDAAWAWAAPLLSENRLASPGWELPLTSSVARLIARRRESGRHGSMDAEASRLREVVARDTWPTQAVWAAFVEAELSGVDGIGSDPESWMIARAAMEVPESPVLARLLVEYGLARAQVLSGDRAAASRTLESVRSSATALGAGLVTIWAEELESRAGLAGEGAPTNAPLTAREQQVLELVAEGLSNGQIAERLYISRKTVSVHVSAILRKLGAASRTEAVRLAAS